MKPYVVRHKFANPPQWLLDGLLQERKKIDNRPCPDCGVALAALDARSEIGLLIETGLKEAITMLGEKK